MLNQFDEQIDRRNTASTKWDTCEELFYSEEVLPMWIADMDFRNPEPVLEAMKDVIDQGVLGYSFPCDSLYTAIIEWQKERHALELTKEHILFSPGVVSSLGLAVQAFTVKGEAVMIHDPVYPPFAHIVEINERKLVRSSLLIKDGKYRMDLVDMEQKFKQQHIKLFFLCHPHNPGGRVWSREELIELIELCRQYNVLVISDEIHGDLIYPSIEFVSPVSIKKEYRETIVTLTSVTKTFNLAGIKNSMIFVYDEELKEKLEKAQEKLELCQINTFGLTGTEAALRYGGPWLQELMAYLTQSRKMVCDFFDQNLPNVFYMVPEATYLCWFNVSALGLKDTELKEYFSDIGKIGLNDGLPYGSSGAQFMRLNFAAPQSVVQEGLERIKKVFDTAKQTAR